MSSVSGTNEVGVKRQKHKNGVFCKNILIGIQNSAPLCFTARQAEGGILCAWFHFGHDLAEPILPRHFRTGLLTGYVDLFLRPELDIYKDMLHSYIVEFKYVKRYNRHPLTPTPRF